MPLPLAPLPPPPARPTPALVVPAHDVQWCRPTFRPPTLPTAHQLYSEIPFSAQFAPKRFTATAAR